MANKTEQWSAQDYKEHVKGGKIEARKIKKQKEIVSKVNSLKEFSETQQTLFSEEELSVISEVINTTDGMREITIILPGEPLPKQSFKSGTQRYRSEGYHTCPWTGNSIKHRKGDVLVYKNKNSGAVDVIPIAYTDKRFTQRTEEYRIMIAKQLPEDFKMFTEEVHLVNVEFIHAPLKSFSNKILKGLQEKTLLKYKRTRGDIDNILKLTLDSMNDLVYSDDSIIVKYENIVKRYGWKPGTIITLKGK
jgi:Holliday junction resolvase RusA-like endonuclease